MTVAEPASSGRPEQLEEPSRDGHRTRIASLDGLRGIAALAVVIHHALLAASPALAAPEWRGKGGFRVGTFDWWISSTPLHVFWAGGEAVLIFFVLSGYVLSIPAVRRGFHWYDSSFYPRRLIRLYLPVWGALIFAAVLHAAQSRKPIVGASWWLNSHPNAMTVKAGVQTATLLKQFRASEYISVLWSLNWEVRYSLLLPGLVILPIVTRRHPIAAAASAVGCFALIGYGTQHSQFQILEYLPMFVLGSLLAFQAPRLQIVVRSRIGSAVFEIVMLAIGIGLLTVSFWTGPPVGAGGANGVQEMVAVLGACILVWGALNLPRTQAALETRPMQWLGSRSFSLYLVHEPIVITLAFAMGGRPDVVGFLVLVLTCSLLAAEGFWRIVERPSVLLSRICGDVVRQRVGRMRIQQTGR
jgi:peptidoglycan/LPS O-acetylase OafA/YrhL